jgi:hypothetical protein
MSIKEKKKRLPLQQLTGQALLCHERNIKFSLSQEIVNLDLLHTVKTTI